MIFIKQIFTLVTIVHLIACDDNVEGSTTPLSVKEIITFADDDILRSTDSPLSATSTTEDKAEQITEAASSLSSIVSSTEPSQSSAVASLKSARSAFYTHEEYPLQSAQPVQSQYAEAPATCSCPCESQQNVPYHPAPDASVTYHDKAIEHTRDSFAYHAAYLSPTPSPPSQPANYLLPQTISDSYSAQAYSVPQPSAQTLPCPKNILISCKPLVQRVPCVSSY